MRRNLPLRLRKNDKMINPPSLFMNWKSFNEKHGSLLHNLDCYLICWIFQVELNTTVNLKYNGNKNTADFYVNEAPQTGVFQNDWVTL